MEDFIVPEKGFILCSYYSNPQDCVSLQGSVAQSVKYLATDASLTADKGVASSIPARSYTLVEIDYSHSLPFR